MEGPKDSPYEGGFYHGVLMFPDDYPYKPPGIMMYTPSGRFKVKKKLCLSNSDFHPESWSPLWTVSSMLAGFVSFMVADTRTYGSMTTSVENRKKLAKRSLAFNCKNPKFRQLFPEYKELFDRLRAENPDEFDFIDDDDGIKSPSSESLWFVPAPATLMIFGLTFVL